MLYLSEFELRDEWTGLMILIKETGSTFELLQSQCRQQGLSHCECTSPYISHIPGHLEMSLSSPGLCARGWGPLNRPHVVHQFTLDRFFFNQHASLHMSLLSAFDSVSWPSVQHQTNTAHCVLLTKLLLTLMASECSNNYYIDSVSDRILPPIVKVLKS